MIKQEENKKDRNFIIKTFVFNLLRIKKAASNTYSKDLPLASPTFRSEEFLITELTIQCPLLLYKSNVGHCIFAMSTVKFFWVPRFPQCH